MRDGPPESPESASVSAPPNEYDAILADEVKETNEYDGILQAEKENGDIRSLLGESSKVQDRESAAARLSEQTGMAPWFVEKNLDQINASWVAANADPERWRRENPELAKAIRSRPHLGKTVMADETISPLTKAARGLAAFGGVVARKAIDPTYQGNAAGEAVAATLPRQVEITQDERAAEIAKKGVLGRAYASGEDAYENMRLSMLGADSADAAALGRDRTGIEAEIADLKQRQGRRQNAQGEYEQILHDFAEGTASNLATGIPAVEAGAVGAVGGAALTRTLPGAVAGFLGGMKLGATASSYRLERGSSYLEFRDLTDDSGKRISDEIALGGSMVAGALKAGVETLSFGSSQKSAGPVLQALTTATGFKAALKDVAFRKIIKSIGMHALESAATEGLVEEPTQTAIDELADWASRTAAQGGVAAKADVGASLAKVGESAAKAIPAGAGHALVITAASSLGNKAAFAAFGEKEADPKALDLTLEVAAAKERANASSPDRVAALLPHLKAMAEGPTAQASPEAAAELAADITAQTGKEVTALYYDPAEVQRLFQDGKESPDALLGPGGQARIDKALTEGTKIEVPLAEWMDRWAKHPAVDSLAEHVADSPEGQTAAEQTAADEAEAARKPGDSEARFRRLAEEQLRKTGLKAGEAKDSVTPYVAALRTLSERVGRDLFDEYAIRFEQGTGEAVAGTRVAKEPAAKVALRELLVEREKLSPEERAAIRGAESGLDPVTGLRTDRAFKAVPVAPGMQVAAISTTDAKPINDHPTAGGHDVTNEVFRAMGSTLADRPDAARGGTNFYVQVKDQADLDALVARMQAAAPGVAIQSALGTDAETAGGALGAFVDAERAAKRLPERGQPSPSLDVPGLSLAEGRAAATVPSEHTAAVAALSAEDYLATEYHEPSGLLTAVGRAALPRKAHQLAFDVKGLRVTNLGLGKPAGDRLLAEFSEAMMLAGAADLAGTHLSGDEYVAESDNLTELHQFEARLHAILDGLTYDWKAAGGKTVKVEVGYRHGIGPTYSAADRALNASRRDPDAGAQDLQARRADLGLGGGARVAEGRGRKAAAQGGGTRLNQGEAPLGPAWFSAVEKSVLSAKQAKNTPAAWLALIRKTPGVRAEEVEFLGLEEWLGRQQGSVTREQVAEFVRANNLKIEEKEPGAGVAADLRRRVDEAAQAVGAAKEAEDRAAADARAALVNLSSAVAYGDPREDAFREIYEEAERRSTEAQEATSDARRDLEVAQEAADEIGAGRTYQDYTLGGHTEGSYKEILFYAPGSPADDFSSQHFGDAGQGLLAHARTSEHEIDGKPVLLVEEVQSDLHQQGRDKGYAEKYTPVVGETVTFERDGEAGRASAVVVRVETNAVEVKFGAYTGIPNEVVPLRKVSPYDKRHGIPSAPLRSTWDEMVAKRMIRSASEKGYEKIAWTTGEQQAERFSLSKQVDEILYVKRDDGRIALEAELANNRRQVLGSFTADELPGVVGAEVAAKIVGDQGETADGGFKSLSGLDLKVGGEGMKVAYDQRIPSIFKSLTKKHGGKIGKEKLDSGHEVWTVTLPTALRETVLREGMPLFQDGEAHPRGYIERVGKFLKIIRTPTADLSTALHEFGHAAFYILQDLAAQPNAPQQVRDDYASALEWAGATDPAAITVEQHEKIARGMEAYLREGKAPSVKLAGAFRRLRDWLVGVYKSVAGLDVELNAEIRGVFDRLLATDREIARMKEAMRFEPMAAAMEGMSLEDRTAYLKKQEEITSKAARRAEVRLMKDLLREKTKEWQTELAGEVAAAGLEYEELPARKAALLLKGEVYSGAEGVTTQGEKFTPEQIAEFLPGLGFPTGEAVAAAVAELQDKAAWSEAKADEAMAEKHPGLMEERAKLTALIGKGLHEDPAALQMELKALAARAGQGAQAIESIQRAAEESVARTKLNDLRPTTILNREGTLSDKAVKAAAGGNFRQAVVFKTQQLINHELYRETDAAADEREAFLDLAKSLAKRSSRERLGKASPAYRDGVDTILEALGLRRPENRDKQPASIAEVVAQLTADNAVPKFDLDVVSAILANPPQGPMGRKKQGPGWKAITVGQMREVVKALENIKAAARDATTTLIDGKRADQAETHAKIMEEAAAHHTHRGDLPPTVAESIGTVLNDLDGWVRRPVEMILAISGGDINSTSYRALAKPLLDAKVREADLLNETARPLLAALGEMPAAARKALNGKIDGKALFPNHKVRGNVQIEAPDRVAHIVAMVLNLGTESNEKRLTEGRGITKAEVIAAANKHLTIEHMQWIQSVLHALDGLWPHAADLEERDSGVRPAKLKHQTITTTHGTFEGGYYPARYDTRVEARPGQKEDLTDPTLRPGTSQGYLKSRVPGFTGAISVDLNGIPQHIAKVVHDIAFREALKSVAGLVYRDGFQAELGRYIGDGWARKLPGWLLDVSGRRNDDSGLPGRAVQMLRANTVTAVLGYSFQTAFGDFSQIPAVLAATDVRADSMASALVECAKSPLESYAWAHAKFGELRTRRGSLNRDLAKQVREITKQGLLDKAHMRWFKDYAFGLMEMSDIATSTPIAVAAYRQKFAEVWKPGTSEIEADRQATEYANSVVQRTFPSHNPVDASAILRSKGFIGQSLMFYGFMNTGYNVAATQIDQVLGKGASLGSRAKAAGRLIGYLVAIGPFSEFLSGRGADRPPEDEEKGDAAKRWAKWFARKMLLGPLTLLPGGGDVAAGIEGYLRGRPHANPRAISIPGALLDLGYAVAKVATSDEDDEKKGKKIGALLSAVGTLSGIPAAAPLRGGRYLGEVAAHYLSHDPDAGTAVRDPFDFASGVLYGRREGQGQNPFSVASDLLHGEAP